ncbi:aldose 1-epimerase family protein [Novosphingobium sp.]|uniref:aldose 1-epimerase family protein n=1 Tax=Novosphingobium sp. TaxID=1874826 RepID=UPI0025D98573|nr:aldose 1-epimerase family protein [Novosphingobium sp.]
MADDLISISSDSLTARINPLGAELWSLTDSSGAEYMTDADPAYWIGHAPVLFPIVGAVRDGRYRLDGREYAIPKHGLARGARFDVVAQDEASATLRFTDSAASRAAYPFAFQLDLAFALEGMTLRMTAMVTNAGPAPLPFSFGFHPAFAWPLPGGAAKDAHRLVFECDEPAPIRRIDSASGLLLPNPQPTPVVGRELTPTPALFEPDALIWDRLSSRAASFGAEGGSWLALAWPDCPMLGVWQKPGADYLCIEPWAGIADPVGHDGDFRAKPGVMELAPGAARSFRMDVTVRPA